MKGLNDKNKRTPKQWFWTILSTLMIVAGLFAIEGRKSGKADIGIGWTIFCVVVGVVGLILMNYKGKDNTGAFVDIDDQSPNCPKCSHSVRPEVKYCTWCGAKIENQILK